MSQPMGARLTATITLLGKNHLMVCFTNQPTNQPTITMLARTPVARTAQLVSKRGFSSTAAKGMHFPHGPYTNLPFKVHGRKVPYGFVHFGFLSELSYIYGE